jgi:hypothetical protein
MEKEGKRGAQEHGGDERREHWTMEERIKSLGMG